MNIRVVRRFLKAVKAQALGEVVKVTAKAEDQKLKVTPGGSRSFTSANKNSKR